MRYSFTLLLALISCGPLLGCDNQDAKHPTSIASDQGLFAAQFPKRIAERSKSVREDESSTRQTASEMPTYPDALKDPPWDIVLSAVEKADSAGKDGAYEAVSREVATTRAFFEEEKDELIKKAAGGAAYAAKQKQCDVDVWGPISSGLKEGIEDRLEERMRAANDASALVERKKETLGKKNTETLLDQVDKIARASYVANVSMPEAKIELDTWVSEASNAKGNLEDLIADEKKFIAEGAPKPEEKRGAEERIKAWETELAKFDAAVEEAKQNSADLEQRSAALKSEYSDALSKLKDAIKAKTK